MTKSLNDKTIHKCHSEQSEESLMNMRTKKYFVYILTNKSFTLYTGVTNDLIRRVWEHKGKFVKGFTQKYNIDKLIYFEEYSDVNEALNREKQIKAWTRKKRIDLIKTLNPNFDEVQL